MKKRNLKNLALNKTVVSSLKVNSVRGGGESEFNTVCPFCNTDPEMCRTFRAEER